MENLKLGMLDQLDGFLTKNHQKTLKSLFRRSSSTKSSGEDDSPSSASDSPKPIPHLSPFANSVVSRCSKILRIPTEQLQHHFDTQLPESVKELLTYARNFLEFCSYQALHVVSGRPDYLSDKEFRHLTFDMMLAWESPCAENNKELNKETASSSNLEVEDDDGWSLFYSSSTNMAVQVDDKKTVGSEAFARIAPGCAAVADIITVHNLYDSLTSTSGHHRLHFLVYDKYIRSLDKVIKASKSTLASSIGNLQLAEGEIILDVDGRLSLTNRALYFESLGVGLYDKAVRYDLATDMKQVIKPEMTGPLGTRLFDKAIMYKSTSVEEPVHLEFPEFKGNSRRDYWLDICLEILRAHRFIQKNNLKEIQKSEVLARAILGIWRYRAVREAFHFFSSHYKTLLAFNLAESLPGGDSILKTLSSRLVILNSSASQHDVSPHSKRQSKLSPISLIAVTQLGFILQKEVNLDGEVIIVGEVCAGESNPLEMVVKQSLLDTGRAEAAQATVDQVKVDGIDTNVAIMKELLFPVIVLANHVQRLASWEKPYKSTVFLVLICFSIIRHFNRGKPLEPFRITPPRNNAVEQLLSLQEAITQVEALLRAGNIILLKIRALLFAVLPQATDKIVILLVFMAATFAFVPLRYIILLVFLEAFTREMPYRKESSDKWVRRIREWWVRIPAAPVQLIKPEDNKKKKS
ncbi:hypothetical protein ACLB2K_033388 [Fragaria x ananassa]